MKRTFIVLGFLFTFFFVLVGSSVYFLNVNDYSQWISQQLKQATGYDVRFEQLESNWFADKSISLTGLSLYQQQTRVLFVNRLDLKVDTLDLWQRQLDIANISLKGVEIDIPKPLNLPAQKIEVSTKKAPQASTFVNVVWERLYLAQLQVTDLNLLLQKEDKRLQLSKANFELNDLLVFENKQLQVIPPHLNIITDLPHLKFNSNNHNLELHNLMLSINAYLPLRQAQMELSSDNIESTLPSQLQLQSLRFGVQLAEDKIALQHFAVNLYQGSLAMEAEAMLKVRVLPSVEFTLKELVLQSFVAKDIQLNIPYSPSLQTEKKQNTDNSTLPIDELLIKSAQLENISVFSESKQLPLQLTSLHMALNNLYVIQDYQWVEPTQLNGQSANFSLAFDSLNWKDYLIEQLSIAGSFEQDDPAWELLKSLSDMP